MDDAKPPVRPLVVGPLVIWLIKKDENPAVGREAAESLNFQITISIAYIVSGLLTMILIGFLLLPIIGIVDLIFIILGAIHANKGEPYRYPFALRLVK